MKRGIFCAIALLAALLAAPGAFAQEDIEQHRSCSYCGMDRAKWSFSRVLIEYGDGSSDGTCSIHCAAVSLALNLDKPPTAIKVADFNTSELIDADSAAWVIGGSKQGVMTARAKWAFAEPEAAAAFVKTNGGQAATFEDAIKGSYEDMYADTKMIRERRAMMRKAKDGQKMEGMKMEMPAATQR